MLDETTGVSLGLLLALIPVAGGFIALWFRIDNRFAKQREERETLFDRERMERQALDDKLDDLKDRMQREFVNHATLTRTEDRLILAIEKLDTRLAEVISKVDAALTRFAAGRFHDDNK